MVYTSSVIDSNFLESLSGQDIINFATAMFAFQQHDAITVVQARFLHTMGLIQYSPVETFKLGDETVQYCCVRFTADGLTAIQEFLTEMELSGKDLESLLDQLEMEISDEAFDLKFVMHDRRLARELAAAPERVKAVIQRYADGFEEELELKSQTKSPLMFEAESSDHTTPQTHF